MKQVISNEKQRVEYLAQSSVLKDPYRLLTNKQLEIGQIINKIS